MRKLTAGGIRFARRIFAFATSWTRIRGYADRAQLHWRFRRAVRRARPIVLSQGGDIQLHLLFGHRTVHEAVATIQSLYRFTPAWPVVLHDDGTLTAKDRTLVTSLLVGVRLIDRRRSDEEVIAHLEKAGLARLADFRRNVVFALKLLDVPFYAAGSRLLMMDTDVLFYEKPVELLAALYASDDEWRDRYSEDFSSSYAWDFDAIREYTGLDILPRVNVGLVALRRPRLWWERYERWLGIQKPFRSKHHLEQTLYALEFTEDGARALAPEYDVMFRASYVGDYAKWIRSAQGGKNVISQHYCGGPAQRRHYYRHYLQRVAPSYGTQSAST